MKRLLILAALLAALMWAHPAQAQICPGGSAQYHIDQHKEWYSLDLLRDLRGADMLAALHAFGAGPVALAKGKRMLVWHSVPFRGFGYTAMLIDEDGCSLATATISARHLDALFDPEVYRTVSFRGEQ